MRAVGVDGCRGGWIAVEHRRAGVVLAPTFAEIVARVAPFDALAVDMPIGLLDAGRTGDRACDKAARAFLRRSRASSVFPPPTRAQLVSSTRPANVTLQAWHLRDKMLEVDDFLASHPDARVVEAHPEVSFAVLGGSPVFEPKRSRPGRARRAALLGRAVPATEREGEVLARADDILDAAVLAWTARRVTRGEARTFPETPERDARRLPMRIVA